MATARTATRRIADERRTRDGRAARLWIAWCAALLAWPSAAAPQHAGDDPIPASVLRARRAALLERVGAGLVVLRGADRMELEEHPQSTDFRQDDDVYYLTGLETPGLWLLLVARTAGPDSAILYLPPRDPREERWTGPELGPGPEAIARTGVDDARPVTRFAEELAERLRNGPPVYASERARAAAGELRDVLGGAPAWRRLEPFTAELRLVKDSVEIARLRRAAAITAEGLRAAMKAAEPGMTEYQVEAIVEYVFRWNGAERVGFPSIVGSGPNSVVLHYNANRRRMEAGDLVVVDVGAEVGYYTADVTRTFPVNGRFTPRQRAIYELVLAAQEAAIRAVRPGVTFAELNALVRRFLRERSDGLCGERTCEAYFVHGLGHWLGLDVHDVGDYATPFAPGMVLTIEPGIYLPEEGLGVRIEDDLLVTATGAELLSGAAPRTPDEIEALMREGFRDPACAAAR
jgi:Xaa-Pro aminopeptidase